MYENISKVPWEEGNVSLIPSPDKKFFKDFSRSNIGCRIPVAEDSATSECSGDSFTNEEVPYALEQMIKLLDSLKYLEHFPEQLVKVSKFGVPPW